jgi:hypothetical protein
MVPGNHDEMNGIATTPGGSRVLPDAGTVPFRKLFRAAYPDALYSEDVLWRELLQFIQRKRRLKHSIP